MTVTEIKIIRYAKKKPKKKKKTKKKTQKTKWDDERLQLQWKDFPTMTWQWICAEKVIRVSQKDNHSAVVKKIKKQTGTRRRGGPIINLWPSSSF